MKPELEYLIVCEYFSISGGNKMNILGVFQELNLIDSKPVSFSFSLVGRLLDVSVGKHSLKIAIYEPNGDKEVATVDLPENESTGTPVSLGFKFNLVEFSKIGKYRIKVFVDGEEVVGREHGIVVKNNAKSGK